MTAIAPGDPIAELVREPSRVQLFAFSAATGNAHRIHYDREYAREREGYPDVLVQSHLHACFLEQAIQATFGARARIQRLEWQNRAAAVPGDQLTVSGQITAANADGVELELALEERNQRGELCVSGHATVTLEQDSG